MNQTKNWLGTCSLFIRFEKFDHRDGNHRYLALSLNRTLLGDWCVERISGPIGAPSGQEKRTYFTSHGEAHNFFEMTRDTLIRRGFVPIPVQMGLL